MRRLLRDTVIPGAVAIGMAFAIQAAVAKPYEIPTGSMIPTIQEHDRIIANRVIYRFRDIRRGDIVVFAPPQAAIESCNPPKGVPFVKRVIGIPGDRVEVRAGKTFVNGAEFVVKNARTPDYSMEFVRVPEGKLLLLGDNRNNSCDSHQWGDTGADVDPDAAFAPIDNVIGQAEVVYWPLTRMRFLD